jgi:hypothetical protein
MKTRKDFERKAIREAERKLGVPAGWWGDYQHVRGPRGVAVRFAASRGGHWILRQRGAIVSRHDSRAVAIRKGAKLVRPAGGAGS